MTRFATAFRSTFFLPVRFCATKATIAQQKVFAIARLDIEAIGSKPAYRQVGL